MNSWRSRIQGGLIHIYGVLVVIVGRQKPISLHGIFIIQWSSLIFIEAQLQKHKSPFRRLKQLWAISADVSLSSHKTKPVFNVEGTTQGHKHQETSPGAINIKIKGYPSGCTKFTQEQCLSIPVAPYISLHLQSSVLLI